jgi:imidazolonepropionase-like amidohydrolase
MKKHKKSGVSRRTFIKGSIAALALASIPDISMASAPHNKILPSIDYSKEIILKNCMLIDMVRHGVIERGSIKFAHGKIVALGQAAFDETNAEVIDIDGAYVLPGLIDGHCHTTASPVFGTTIWQIPKLLREGKRQYNLCIEAGITTVRDMGSFPPLLHGNIKDIEKGTTIGPRIIYCNSIMNIKGSHPDVKPTDVSIFAEIVKPLIGLIPMNFETMDDLKEALEKNARGASFIKLTVDNKSIFCKTGNIPIYSNEHLRDIFNFAEKNNLPVSCHNHRKWGFDRITRYPINSLEHMIGDAYLSETEIVNMAKRNISIVPTMAIARSFLLDEAYASGIPKQFRTDFIMNEIAVRKNYLKNEAQRHFDPELIQSTIDELKYYRTLGWDHLIEYKKYLVNPDLYFGIMLYGPDNLRKMKDAGVLIGCGIDAGMPYTFFGGQYREYELLSRIGFKNEEILRCATINNARILKMDDKIGSLAAGKFADIAVFSENPLQKIEALRKPSMAFKEGRLLHCCVELKKRNAKKITG